MTRHDLRFALIVVAVVLGVGWAIGYGVGWVTKSRSIPIEQADRAERSLPEVSTATGDRYPNYRDVYVNDYADLLDPDAERRVRNRLIDLYDHSGIEMTVLTISSMSDFGHQGPIEPFATGLFNAWGIGNAASNDGILVLVARQDRRMRIELGAGYDTLWDDRMQKVIDTGFLPDFREDRYQDGIEQGVDDILISVTGSLPEHWEASTTQQGFARITRVVEQSGGWLLGLLLVPVGGLVMWIRAYLRNRPKPCSECRTLMQRAGEKADDEHLDGGQRLEEYLKSVDYDVWHCPECGHMDITRYRNWFTTYGACPQCSYRTLSTTSTILVAATTSRTGSKRVDYDCKHCAYHSSEIRTIPKRSESSSGSSRSSFGGGSSSSGGASGSW